MNIWKLSLVAAFFAAPVLAEDLAPGGDATAGETAFARQCVACHVVVNDAGEKLAGRNARTGPNLYGVAGGTIGSVDGFRYGDAIKELNEQGAQWDEDSFVAYVQDPTLWLRETLDDSRARSKMAYRVRTTQDAQDIFAYLASLAE